MTDQVVLAALPQIRAVVVAAQQLWNTTMTGDPIGIPGRFAAATVVFQGNVALQLMAVLPAEAGAVQADVNDGFAKLLAKIDAVK